MTIGRLTQEVTESLFDVVAAGRQTQEVIETLYDIISTARITQQVIEVLLNDTPVVSDCQDIFNVNGDGTGNQRQGRIRVFSPGDPKQLCISGNRKIYNPEDSLLPTSTGRIVSISGKYCDRFDDITYYWV